MSKIILVAGATGNQGGAVARHLVKAGFTVKGLTRNPNSESAERLRAAGIEPVKGDMNDTEALTEVMEGAYGAFSVQNMMGVGVEAEQQQGINFANAAKAAGIQHLVYSSVDGAERNSGVPHFVSKWNIEEHIRKLGIPHTILRPVFFMDNLKDKRFRFVLISMLAGLMRKNTPLQMVAVEDIGHFASLAFQDPATWKNRAFALAGDELSYPQIREAFHQITGKRPGYFPMPGFMTRLMSKDMYLMLKWFEQHGYEADIKHNQQIHADMLDFNTYLKAITAEAENKLSLSHQA